MKHFIAVAGNIGAGKTTLAKKLANHFGFELFEEPFAMNPYLEKFYADMKTWAFRCELSFLGHRLQNHLAIVQRETSVIQDRCIYEGAEVFAKNLYLNNHLSEHDWHTFWHLYENLKLSLPKPDLVVYLKSSSQRCFNNLQARQRDIELNVTPDYLASLHNLYEQWRAEFNLCPIVVADADIFDFKYDSEAFGLLADKIMESYQ